jgi:hypothetical protein
MTAPAPARRPNIPVNFTSEPGGPHTIRQRRLAISLTVGLPVTAVDRAQSMACPATVTALDPVSGTVTLAMHGQPTPTTDPHPNTPPEASR